MTTPLFPKAPTANYLLDIKYQGASFNGAMEIDALGREILGLETCLQRTIELLKKHKRIEFDLNDVDIFVEAFEHGSFKKRVKLIFRNGVKTVEDYPATSNIVAIVFVGVLGVFATLKAGEVKNLSPQAIEKLKDQVKIELLQDKSFINGLTDIVRPIRNDGDKLIIKEPAEKEATIDYEQRNDILELSNSAEENIPDGTAYETLKGHITRVDLDADINHIGFKVDDKGALILCTLPNHITRDQMKDYLDQWVQIEGIVTYKGGERRHVNVDTLTITQKPKQIEIDFSHEAKD